MKKGNKQDFEEEYQNLLKKLRVRPVSQEFVRNSFTNRTNLKITYRGWNSKNRNANDKLTEPDKSLTPSDKPLNIIVFCHGMITHTRRCVLLADEFFSRGGNDDYLIFALDYQGHGLSEGHRGNFKSLNVLIDDVEDFMLLLSSNYPNAKFSLWGESMGGLVVLTYLVERNIQSPPYKIISSVLWCPAIKPFSNISFKNLINGVWSLLVYIFSRKANPMPAQPGTSFKDPDLDRLDAIDPLKVSKYSMGYLLAVNSAMKHLQKQKFWEKLTVPTCYLVGTADRVVSREATLKFYNKIVDNDLVKKDQHHLINIEGGWHILYYDESMIEEHWNQLIDFMKNNR